MDLLRISGVLQFVITSVFFCLKFNCEIVYM